MLASQAFSVLDCDYTTARLSRRRFVRTRPSRLTRLRRERIAPLGGERVTSPASRFDLSKAAELHHFDCVSRRLSASTIYRYKLVEGRFIDFLTADCQEMPGPLPLTALNMDTARAFIVWLRTEHQTTNTLTGQELDKGARTIQDHVRALKTFGTFLYKEGLVDRDPLDKLRLPKVAVKVIEIFRPEHLAAMLDVISGQPQRERNRAIVYLFLATGARASELAGIKFDDVDMRNLRVKVLGKGDKERWVHFDATTAKLMLRYKVQRAGASGTDPFFVSRYGAPINRNSLRQFIHKLGVEAGIKNVRVSPHTFRHTFATQFLRAHPGALFHLQELLGHTDLDMVRRYAKVAEADAQLEGPSPVQAFGLDRLAKRW